MASPTIWSTRNIIVGTLLIAAIAALLVFLIRFAQVVFVILLALTLSTALDPLVDWLQSRGIRRLIGTMVIYGGLLILVLAFLGLIFPLLFSQTTTIGSRLPEYYNSFRQSMLTSPVNLVKALGAQFPVTLQDLLSTAVTDQGTAAGVVGQVGGVLFDLLLTFLLSFYWTLDSDRAIRFFILRLPESQRDQVREGIATFKDKLGAYIRGQSLLCLAVGVMAVVAYFIIKIPYAFSLGLIYGVFEAVPMIGPIIGLFPALLLALATAPDKVLWVILAGLIIQQLENNLLVPRVMGQAVGVNPVVSILAIGAFSLLFGIGGAILAVPVAAVIQVALDRFIFSNPDLLPTAVGTPGAAPFSPSLNISSSSPTTVVTATVSTTTVGPTTVGPTPVGGESNRGSSAVANPPSAENPAQGIASEALNSAQSNATDQDANPAEWALPSGRGRLSVLHLELHELTQDIRNQQRKKDALADPVTDEIEDEMEATAQRLYEIIVRNTALQAKNSSTTGAN